jgi:hypothetical protein
MKSPLFFCTSLCLFIIACGNPVKQSDTVTISATESKKLTTENYLSMDINGVQWKADHDIFGAFHPKGYNNVIMISGKKGAKDATEQGFNINIYNTVGTGSYYLKNDNTDLSVAQMSGWDEQNFICGSGTGFEMRVKITSISSNPDLVEATFEGEMICVMNDILKITNGKFYYHE